MTHDNLFLITLLAISCLSAFVAHGMFKVGKMSEFEMSKMYFAAAVLAFLAFIFMLSIIIYAFGTLPTQPPAEAPGKAIFDACVKIIPPLVTLIIGFYFGTSQGKVKAEQNKAVTVTRSKVSRRNRLLAISSKRKSLRNFLHKPQTEKGLS